MNKKEFKKQLMLNNDLNNVMIELDKVIYKHRIFKNLNKCYTNAQNFKNKLLKGIK